jgi:MFS family permease
MSLRLTRPVANFYAESGPSNCRWREQESSDGHRAQRFAGAERGTLGATAEAPRDRESAAAAVIFWRIPLHAAFLVASFSLVLVFAAAGTPIPLYNTYRASDGITNGDLALVSVAYFVAAATALLVLGRLSNHLGRRPVALTALASAAISCLVLLAMHGVVTLLVARVLQGLASGLASSALGAYVIDSAGQRPRWLAAAITGNAPMIGIPVGALGCGALVEYAPAPRLLVYAVMAILLVACIAMISMSPETVTRVRGALTALRPRLQVPSGCTRLVLAASAAYVATWSLGGFYQAFGPSVTAQYLGTSNALVAAAVFSSVMILTPFGAPLSARLSAANGLRLGIAVFMVTLVAIVSAIRAGAIVQFIAASLVVGLAQGVAATGAIRALLTNTGASERAGLLATIYLIAYTGAAVPAMIAGQLTKRFDLAEIAEGYAALGIAASVIAIVAARSRAPLPVRSPHAAEEYFRARKSGRDDFSR